MKFRTEIDVKPLARQFGYDSRLFAVGSCFADHVSARLAAAGFRIAANPAGVMFNPLSAADTIGRCAARQHVDPSELGEGDEGWFHFGFHGSFSRSTPKEAAEAMNRAVDEGHRALTEADTVIVTFGTAYVFRLTENCVTVANCHRQPASMFSRERLTVGEITERWGRLMENELRDRHVILTVSPVRHLADGLEGNMLGKSILRVAAAEIAERYENADYFPAYEILCDDLRDYRFYADDLVHPSAAAVGYVWEKFAAAALTAEARGVAAQVEAIVAAAAHRPLHPGTESHRAFCRRQLEAAEALQRSAGVDLGAEIARFAEALQAEEPDE